MKCDLCRMDVPDEKIKHIHIKEKLKNIKKEQLRDSYPEFGVSFPNPNFAEYAKIAGGEGYRITNPKELDKTLKKHSAQKNLL